MVLENVISTKHYFQHKENITNFSYEIQNPKHYFQLEEITSQCEYEIQNPKHYFQLEEITSQCKYEIQNPKHFQPKEIAVNFSYKIQNHRRYLNVSRNIIT